MRDFDIPNHDQQLDAPYEREWREGEDDEREFDEDCEEGDN